MQDAMWNALCILKLGIFASNPVFPETENKATTFKYNY